MMNDYESKIVSLTKINNELVTEFQKLKKTTEELNLKLEKKSQKIK